MAKIKNLPNYQNLNLQQNYSAKIHQKYGHSRYVILFINKDWHITFFPRDPANDPYNNSAYDSYQYEEYTKDNSWHWNWTAIGELDYSEFHVTTGKLHKGAAKHFFYDESGNFLREEGDGITDEDRKTADEIRLTIKPQATRNARNLSIGQQIGWLWEQNDVTGLQSLLTQLPQEHERREDIEVLLTWKPTPYRENLNK
jgi:hypothetical protein